MVFFLRRRFGAWGRWPRRVLALICLALAAVTALSPGSALGHARSTRPPVSGHRRSGLAGALSAGQVAVPVGIGAAAAAAGIQPGDRVGLLTAPTDGDASGGGVSVGDQLRVLAVHRSADDASLSDGGAVLVVAADRAVARQIATHSDGELLAVIETPP